MKYLFIIAASLMLIAGCGKSQQELEKERIQKEANELRHKIDSTNKYIENERKSIDSITKQIDSLSYKIDDTKKKLDKMDPIKQNEGSKKKSTLEAPSKEKK